MERSGSSFITQRIKKKQNTSELLYKILESVESVLGCSGGMMVLNGMEPTVGTKVIVHPAEDQYPDLDIQKLEGLIDGCGEIQNRMVLSGRTLEELGIGFRSAGNELAAVVEPILINQYVGGVIIAVCEHKRRITREEYEILQLYARQAGMVVENAALISAVQDRAVRAMQMNHLTSTALRARDLDSLLRVLSEGMADLMHADGCLIVLWDEDREEAHPMSAFGSQQDTFPQETLGVVDQDIVRNVLSSSRVYVTEDFPRSGFGTGNSVVLRRAQSALAMPLISGHSWLGVIFLTFGYHREFVDDEIQLCEQAASQAVLALAKTQAFEAEQQRNAELEALRKANLSITSSLDLNQVLDQILQQALSMVDGQDAHIFLVEDHDLTFGAARWIGDSQSKVFKQPRKDGITYSVARSGLRIVVEDVNSHPLFQNWQWGGAIIGLPIRVGEQIVGVMNVAYDAPHKFSKAEIRVLELMADQAAIALENANLFKRMDAERQRVSFLYDVAREVGSSLSLRTTVKQATERITKNLGGYFGSGFVYHEEKNVLKPSCLFSSESEEAVTWNQLREIRMGEGIEGWVAQEQRYLLLEDFRADERWANIGVEIPEEVRSLVSVPLLSGSDLYGVITILSEEPFDQSQINLIEAVSRQVGLALSNAASYQSLQRKLNERQLLQQIAQAVNKRYELEPLLTEVARQIAGLLDLKLVEIFLKEGEALRLRASNEDISECCKMIALDQGVVGRAARERRSIFVEDVLGDPDYVVVNGSGDAVESEIAVPLTRADDVIGVLNVEADKHRRLHVDDLRLLTLVSDQIAVAIERAGLYERLRDQTYQLEELVAERTSELENALEHARNADKAKTQFVADVSHELRTPLTNIQLYLELLSMGSKEKLDEYLETLHRETDRLTTLIEDLLAISRLDNDTAVLSVKMQDLNAVVERLVQDRKRLFSEKGVELSFMPQEDLQPVMADEDAISQVIANLMTNALQYTHTGGSVTLRTYRCDEGGRDRICLDVEDTGLGISEEEQEQLFTRFFRGSASREMKTPGTGLGLAICREILLRHDGDITVESELDQGTVFTMWLPVMDQE